MMARAKRNFLCPSNTLQYSSLGLNKLQYNKCYAFARQTIWSVPWQHFSISPKPFLTFLLELSFLCLFMSCLRSTIASYHNNFIIPKYFHRIWQKWFIWKYKRKCNSAHLGNCNCRRFGWISQSSKMWKTVSNANMVAQETFLDLWNNAVCLQHRKFLMNIALYI